MSNIVWTPPSTLSWSVFKTPRFNTLKQEAVSGKTTRAALWASPLWDYKLTFECIKDLNATPPDIDVLMDFFLARMGSFDTFLYSDPSDNAAAAQTLGFGDGVQTAFQIGRSLGGNAFEPIQYPYNLTLRVNGVTQSGFQYAFGTENLLLSSQAFVNSAAWNANKLTITDNFAVAPDGTTSASKLAVATSVGSNQTVQALPAFGIMDKGDYLIFSIYGQQGTAGVKLQLQFNFFNAAGNLMTTAVQAAQTLTGSWTRFSYSQAIPLGAASVSVLVIVNGASSVGDNVLVWGGQVERTDFSHASPTGYLATTTAPYTSNGRVTIATPPPQGQVVAADFSFYYRVRFKNDLADFEQFVNNLWTLKSLELVSEKQ